MSMSVAEKTTRPFAHADATSLCDAPETLVDFVEADAQGFGCASATALHGLTTSRRLPFALMGVAFLNLAAFCLCQWIYVPDGRADYRHPLIWFLELLAVLGFLRVTLGAGWVQSSPALRLVVKFWTTFLILSFNLLTLNSQTGFDLAWYKPVWATLSTFLFASLAWTFSPWFFVPAVQMWATGLLIVNLPDWGFLIYGVSWWLALAGVAVWLNRKQTTRR